MKRLAVLSFSAALAGAAACSPPKSETSAPWLTMPSLATHTALYFPIDAGTVHGPMAISSGPGAGQKLQLCAYCHGDRSVPGTYTPGSGPPPPQAPSFKTFTCTMCHVEIRPGVYHDDPSALTSLAKHVGVAGFDPSAAATTFDASCRTCHPMGWAVNHQNVFPVPHGTGAHVAACGECHLNPFNRTQLACATCHAVVDPVPTATAHAAVPDFDPAGDDTANLLCARCHGDGVVPVKVAAHKSFPITTGFHTGLKGGACLTCHTASMPDPKAFAADFTPRTDTTPTSPTCTGCHVPLSAAGNIDHADGTALANFHAPLTSNFQFTSTACLGCHPDGAGGAPPYHDQLFVISAGSSHAGISCAACHGSPTVRNDITFMACVSCHADYAAGHAPARGVSILVQVTAAAANCVPVALPALTNADCLYCHGPGPGATNVRTFDPSTLITTHLSSTDPGAELNRNGEHRGAGCYTCHFPSAAATRQVPVNPGTATPPTNVYFVLDYSQPSPVSTGTAGCANCHAKPQTLSQCPGN